MARGGGTHIAPRCYTPWQMAHGKRDVPRCRLTSAQVKSYLAHWRAVHAFELQELQAASAEHKLRQVAALMKMVAHRP